MNDLTVAITEVLKQFSLVDAHSKICKYTSLYIYNIKKNKKKKKKKTTCIWQIFEKFVHISKGIAEFDLQDNIYQGWISRKVLKHGISLVLRYVLCSYLSLFYL